MSIRSSYLRFVRLAECTHIPAYQTPGAAGLDVYAANPSTAHPWRCVGRVEVEIDGTISVMRRAGGPIFCVVQDAIALAPGDRLLVPIGVRVAVPAGYELQIRPRSGLAMRHGLTVANSPGTIDSDYRGPVGVLLVNHGRASVPIRPGDRIAQMVLAPVARAIMHEQAELTGTTRGDGGWGSTGVNEAAGRPDAR